MFHCHESCDEEGFVADFGEDDHDEREEEGVEGLGDAVTGIGGFNGE